MNIDLAKLDFEFQCKPLLIGGKAMEYYGLRQAGADIDFVIKITTDKYGAWWATLSDEQRQGYLAKST